MSWITPYCLDHFDCDCLGGCDCADQRDLAVTDAWEQHDQATTRLRHSTAPAGCRAGMEQTQADQPARRLLHDGPIDTGRDATPLPASRPTTFTAEHKRTATERYASPHARESKGVADRTPTPPLRGRSSGNQQHTTNPGPGHGGVLPPADELAARRNTRPLSNAVGDVVPIRPPDDTGPRAA